ncbi:membrane protein [Hasllibacter halocynthiae]|uniref:Membrane protein n=1 Tax=Hasllibacter halocynthiae TaxID=595589 RepID=A0A2T0X997_9RHOB|nr:YihY/virulence factor BrkB family protein [Hasllibacter halocynthiae]PRY95497.1 membrane protein [Hasllibacter halocynthiae]
MANRGRHATKPTEISKAGWKDILLRTKDEIANDRVGLVAAGIAFYGLLALFPGIAAVMAIAGIVADPNEITGQIQQLTQILPQQAAEIVIDQATEIAGEETGLGFTAILGLLLSLWSASAAMRSAMQGLNIAYDETEDRGFVKFTAVRLALTLGVVLGFFVTVAAIVLLPIVLEFLPLGPTTNVVITIARWPLVAAIAMLGLAILYRFGPSRDDAEWAWLTPGSVAATVLWLIGSVLFAWYVRSFGSYQETFGSLGGVVVLLMWMWISAYIVLMGAELNAETEAQTRHDTTVGEARRMGERDAEPADHLGKAKADA